MLPATEHYLSFTCDAPFNALSAMVPGDFYPEFMYRLRGTKEQERKFWPRSPHQGDREIIFALQTNYPLCLHLILFPKWMHRRLTTR